MDRFEPIYCSPVYPHVYPCAEMELSKNGDWMRYEDAAARIAELEAQLEAAQELAASYRNALMAAEAANDN